MGTRTYMCAVKSLEPIKAAIGSKDEALLDAFLATLADPERFVVYPPKANERFLGVAREMIMNPRPEVEPGAWCYLLERLAELKGLAPAELPLDEWRHYFIWEEYRSTANPDVSSAARDLLELLDLGRPFHGASIDHEGGAFAWLTPDEAKLLLDDLREIDASSFGDLEDFHEELVASLQEAVNAQCAVLLTAC